VERWQVPRPGHLAQFRWRRVRRRAEGGQRSGYGTYIFRSGSSYVGEWKDGHYNGQGTATYIQGDRYVGEWKDGNRHGQGTLFFTDGGKYSGEWKDGMHDGRGIRTFADGKPPQEGIWIKHGFVRAERIPDHIAGGAPPMATQSSLPTCDATLAVTSWTGCIGTRATSTNNYVGEFRDGKFHGLGVYTLHGENYVGEFREGKFHGRGIYSYTDGRAAREGIWESDRFVRVELIPDKGPRWEYFRRLTKSSDLSTLYRQSPGPLSDTRPPFAQTPRQAEPPRSESVPIPRQAEPPRSTLSLAVTPSPPDANGVVTFAITTNSDTASLKINGDEEGGRADGRYSVRRFAQVGENRFEVVATDRFGNTQRQTISVNREFAQTAPTIPALNPLAVRASKPRDAVAIVIGIEKYRSVPAADFANRDASIFVDYARRALGVSNENIRLMLDDKADSVEILVAFKNWLPTRVNKGKTDVYVFYSGHGLPSEDGNSLYFLPHEANRELLERTAISQREIIQAIQRTTPKSVTMFIDSCYSGQSRTGETLLASARPISIVAKETSNFPANFTVISASAPDQISSSSPELRHWIFSYYLMRGMEGEADANKDGQITVAETQAYLAERVPRRAMGMNRTQQPQVVGDQTRVLVVR